MQLFDRLKTGVMLVRDSLLLIAHNRGLALFPVAAAIAGGAFLALFLGISFGLLAVNLDAGAMAVLAVAYFLLTFLSTFFTAGLVHQTRATLAGEEPSLRVGLEAAWDVKRSIAIWAAISATIGVLINGLENSDSRASRVLGSLFGLAWTLLTFFVVPVIVFEKPSVKEMFTRSGETFKQTWGETPISLFAVNLIGVVVAVPFVLVGIAAFNVGLQIVAAASILLGVLLSFLVSQTLQGVIKTTLYLYAREGQAPEEFDDVDFDALPADRTATSTATRTRTTP